MNWREPKEVQNFVSESGDKTKLFIDELTKDVPKELRFIILGRILNLLFAGFYKPMVIFAQDRIDQYENNKFNGETN